MPEESDISNFSANLLDNRKIGKGKLIEKVN